MICKLKLVAIVAMSFFCVFTSCAKSNKAGTPDAASTESAQLKQVTVWFCFSKDLPTPLPTEKYDKATLEFMRRTNVDDDTRFLFQNFYAPEYSDKIKKIEEDMNLSNEAFKKLIQDENVFKSVLCAEPLVLDKPEKGETIVYDLPVCLFNDGFWSSDMKMHTVSGDYTYYNGCFEGWRTKDGEIVNSLEITESTESDIYLRPSYRDPQIGDKVFCLRNVFLKPKEGFRDYESNTNIGSTVYAGMPIEIFASNFDSKFGRPSAIVSPKIDVHEVLVDFGGFYTAISPIEVFKVAKELGRVCFFMKADESDKFKFIEPLSQFEDGTLGFVMPYDYIDFDGFAADYSAIPDNVRTYFGRVTNGHHISYAKFSGNKASVSLDNLYRDEAFSNLKYKAFAVAANFSKIKWNDEINLLYEIGGEYDGWGVMGLMVPSMAQWKIIYDNIDAFSESKYNSKYKFGSSVISSSLDGAWGMFATLDIITGEIDSDIGIGNRLFGVFPINCGIR